MKKLVLIAIAIMITAGFMTIDTQAALMTENDMSIVLGRGGKGGGGSTGGYTPVDPDGLTSSQFYNLYADNTVYYWEGLSYSVNGNGDYGIDGAGTVVETVYNMGYDLPVTTADGLYYNYYTSYGYDYSFWYTKTSTVSDYNLDMGDYWLLDKGDLLFLDYNFDYEYDHVATYLGYYQGISDAVLTASDYWGQVVIADMNDYMDPFAQDMLWSNVSTKKLDYYNIEMYY